jgi:phage-related protein
MMANEINYNLLLVAGIVGVGGYYLYKSGFLQNVGQTATNISTVPNTAINDTSSTIQNATNQLSTVLQGFESNITTFENQLGNNFNNLTTVPNNILTTVENSISSFVNSLTQQKTTTTTPTTTGNTINPLNLIPSDLGGTGVNSGSLSSAVSNANQSKSSNSGGSTYNPRNAPAGGIPIGAAISF